jgi:hypothetical protein
MAKNFPRSVAREIHASVPSSKLVVIPGAAQEFGLEAPDASIRRSWPSSTRFFPNPDEVVAGCSERRRDLHNRFCKGLCRHSSCQEGRGLGCVKRVPHGPGPVGVLVYRRPDGGA